MNSNLQLWLTDLYWCDIIQYKERQLGKDLSEYGITSIERRFERKLLMNKSEIPKSGYSHPEREVTFSEFEVLGNSI